MRAAPLTGRHQRSVDGGVIIHRSIMQRVGHTDDSRANALQQRLQLEIEFSGERPVLSTLWYCAQLKAKTAAVPLLKVGQQVRKIRNEPYIPTCAAA